MSPVTTVLQAPAGFADIIDLAIVLSRHDASERTAQLRLSLNMPTAEPVTAEQENLWWKRQLDYRPFVWELYPGSPEAVVATILTHLTTALDTYEAENRHPAVFRILLEEYPRLSEPSEGLNNTAELLRERLADDRPGLEIKIYQSVAS